ncbi:DUF2515 family protein [Bacillus massilinigeriensis]|uniref:DUF2515 family protein n=1 Tax=Bacillus mediterraneensis TaxID=1805474 RepID=UPI0008F82378|nr:DUF2515 family protein [Bacillus mediterraneensis]
MDYNLSLSERALIQEILLKTSKFNDDNISRTEAYLIYYLDNPEISWAFLASMVSRNGGYNMCDLEGEWFPRLLRAESRRMLFYTYERANWLIFKDAYPQLLLYKYCTTIKQPMFHLLKYFGVSKFMQEEWSLFWQVQDKKRLLNALIINEQNVIHTPVMHHHSYKRKVFGSMMFLFQDHFHYSAVLLPNKQGDLYGASVAGFRSLGMRIDLGKRLAAILFEPSLYRSFIDFAISVPHTGSRHDYERFMLHPNKRDTPFLRAAYPVISHSLESQQDWYGTRKLKKYWLKRESKQIHPIKLTKWFMEKRRSLHTLVLLGEVTGVRL